MSDTITVYGKTGCSFTRDLLADLDARDAPYRYFDLSEQPEHLSAMLRYSGGRREVPVIVRGEKVIIGYPGTCPLDG